MNERVIANAYLYLSFLLRIDPLHKWCLNLNNNTHTSLASHSCENSFVLKHECEANDIPSIVIDCFHDPIMQYVLGGSLHKNNTIYFLLGLDHASGN